MDELLRELIYFFRIHRIFYKFSPRLKPSMVILCYHRISTVKQDDPISELKLSVPLNSFKSHLKLFNRKYLFASPDDLLKLNKYPHSSEPLKILLTFDDGYKDFILNAFPLLKKYKIPSLLYVSTAMIDENMPFWWDIVYPAIAKLGLPPYERLKEVERLKRLPIVELKQEIQRYIDLSGHIAVNTPPRLSWDDGEVF